HEAGAELQQLLLAARELAAVEVHHVRELELLEQLDRPRARLVLVQAERHAADHQVVEGADPVEHAGHLEHAQHAQARELRGIEPQHAAAVEPHLARIGPQVAGEHVEQRRLAGAIGPDQADQLALRHVHADAVERLEAAEALADLANLEQCHHAPFAAPAAPRRRAKAPRASPQRPSRKKRAKMITSRAKTIIWMLPTSRSSSEAT